MSVRQFSFADEMAAQLTWHKPYSKHAIQRTTQAEDMVYTGQHGDLCIATSTPRHTRDTSAGFSAHVVAASDPTATPCPAGPGGPPLGGRPHG